MRTNSSDEDYKSHFEALVGCGNTILTHALVCVQYDDGEEVYLWMNKVGPFPNPQETYPYYSLPFCHPDKLIHSDTGRSPPCSNHLFDFLEESHTDRPFTEGLGEALVGYDLIKSMVEIFFKSTRSCHLDDSQFGRGGGRVSSSIRAGDIERKPICSKSLTKAEYEEFREAILEQYWCTSTQRFFYILQDRQGLAWCSSLFNFASSPFFLGPCRSDVP